MFLLNFEQVRKQSVPELVAALVWEQLNTGVGAVPNGLLYFFFAVEANGPIPRLQLCLSLITQITIIRFNYVESLLPTSIIDGDYCLSGVCYGVILGSYMLTNGIGVVQYCMILIPS